MKARRVNKYHLVSIYGLNTQYLLPRRLGLARRNTELLLK